LSLFLRVNPFCFFVKLFRQIDRLDIKSFPIDRSAAIAAARLIACHRLSLVTEDCRQIALPALRIYIRPTISSKNSVNAGRKTVFAEKPKCLDHQELVRSARGHTLRDESLPIEVSDTLAFFKSRTKSRHS
jgi:hypothetical protein